MTHHRLIVVTADAAELRVDQGLAKLLPELSRRVVQRLCAEGRVLRHHRQLSKSDLLHLGDHIAVLASGPPVACADPATSLDVRLETEQWIVVNKPAQQPTAPRTSTDLGTLANALVSRYPELHGIGHSALEPGLLHRLDNGTSGLLVAARTPEAFAAGTSALRGGQWHKHYLLLVEGTGLPEAGAIAGSLTASRRNPRRVEFCSPVTLSPAGPKNWLDETGQLGTIAEPARHMTRFCVQRRLPNRTLVECFVHAAFRHQIRAHFAAVGSPLVNDVLYGAAVEPRLAELRHALHAARVAWSGDAVLTGFDIAEPLPLDLLDLLVD